MPQGKVRIIEIILLTNQTKVKFGDIFISILNVATNERILLKRERGTYVLEIDMEDNEQVFTRRE